MPGFMKFAGYETVARLSTKAKKTDKACEKLKKTFYKWNDDEQGGLLTYKLANKLARHIRDGLADGSAFLKSPPPPGLSDMWASMKKRYGLHDQMGYATGQMAEAIRAFPAGKGGYTVGISSEARTSTRFVKDHRGRRVKVGNIQQIGVYAYMFEKGYVGPDHVQPPRPFFFPAFWSFVKDELPQEVRQTILKDMKSHLMEISRNMELTYPRYDPEDFYQAWDDEEGGPSGGMAGGARETAETMGGSYEDRGYGVRKTEKSVGEIESGWKKERRAERKDEMQLIDWGDQQIYINANNEFWDEATGSWRDLSELL